MWSPLCHQCWVCAGTWLTLTESRSESREQKVHPGEGAGWGLSGCGLHDHLLSRPLLSQALALSLNTSVSFSTREPEGCSLVVDSAQRTRVNELMMALRPHP